MRAVRIFRVLITVVGAMGLMGLSLAIIGLYGLVAYAVGRRTRAARLAREFPVLLEALTDGRLHLSGITLLAPHLNAQNFESLFDSAVGKTKREIEEMVARHFPQTESLPLVTMIPTQASSTELQAVNFASDQKTLSAPGPDKY